MSYALNVADDARRILETLPFEVQEQAWDVLDALAADPDRAQLKRTSKYPIHVLVFHDGNKIYHVGLYIVTDHQNQVLHIPAIFPILEG